MMIRNEQQYNTTKEWLQKFEQSVAEIDNNESLKADPLRWKMYREAYQSQVIEFYEEIAEYERFINCDKSQPIQIKIENFNKLPDVLVKARIAAKITQKELAEILGVDEQRVKEYEDTDYQCASFVEVLEVSAALGVEFKDSKVEVDFEEIETFKKSAEKFHKWQQEKKSNKHQISSNDNQLEIA